MNLRNLFRRPVAAVVVSVEGERGRIPSVNQSQSIQSRLATFLILGLVGAFCLAIATWYYVTQIGMWMQQVAFGWLVLEMTDSPLYLGLAGFFRAIPMLLITNVPVRVLVNKLNSPVPLLVLLVMSIACFFISEWGWRASVRHYTSASS